MKKFLIVLGLLSVIMPNVVLAVGTCDCYCINDTTKVKSAYVSEGTATDLVNCQNKCYTRTCTAGNTNMAEFKTISVVDNTVVTGKSIVAGVRTQCIQEGNCEVNDFLRLGVSITNWILGIVGSLVILMFVYGGFKMVISRGEAKEIQSGKDIIKAAVIGTVIVFSSYVVIKFFMQSMGFDWRGTSAMPVLINQGSGGDSSCTAKRGTCQEDSNPCTGSYTTGDCSGGNTRRCCVPATK